MFSFDVFQSWWKKFWAPVPVYHAISRGGGR